jgi:peptide/nickel transport system substrate-binding protein
MKAFRRIVALAVTVVIIGFVGIVCAASQDQPQKGGTLRFVLGVPITHLTLGKSEASIAATVKRGIFETLVERDMEGNFLPSLAKSWKVSGDSLTWSFALQEGVMFHDGHELTAQDVKASFDRMLDPKYELALSSVLKVIASVSVDAKYTVSIRTEKPVADMLARLSWSHAGIMSKPAIEKWGTDIDWHPVGTGPYKYDSHVPGESITLVKFDEYWGGREGPYLDKLIFLTVREDATRVAMLQAGEADIIVNLPTADVARLKSDPTIVVRIDPSTRVAHIGVNCQKAPFDNAKVRQALNYAIDREGLIAGVLKGVGMPSKSFISPIVWGWHGVDLYSYNPGKAKQLLAEAGYPNGFKTTLWTPQGRYFADKETAVAVQDMLNQIGLKVTVQVIDWATYLKLLTTPLDTSKTEMYLLGWESGTGDIAYINDLVISSKAWPPNGWNTMFYKNEMVDELIAKSRNIMVPEKRHKVVAEEQKKVVNDAPWIFLYVYQMTAATSVKVEGLEFLPTEVYAIEKVWLKR